MKLLRHLILLAAGALLVAAAQAAELTPVAGAASAPPAPWHVVGLPVAGKPLTQFSVEDVAGRRALRVEAERSYGNLLHPVSPGTGLKQLSWQWRIDKLNEAADLRERKGDDTTLRVCVSFDMAPRNVPLMERPMLSIARLRSSAPIPNATACYVWDNKLAVGTTLDNAFTRRMRYMVLQSGAAGAQDWHSEQRDVAADFLRLFGSESPTVPPIVSVAIGADADNTKGHSIGHVTEIVLAP